MLGRLRIPGLLGRDRIQYCRQTRSRHFRSTFPLTPPPSQLARLRRHLHSRPTITGPNPRARPSRFVRHKPCEAPSRTVYAMDRWTAGALLAFPCRLKSHVSWIPDLLCGCPQQARQSDRGTPYAALMDGHTQRPRNLAEQAANRSQKFPARCRPPDGSGFGESGPSSGHHQTPSPTDSRDGAQNASRSHRSPAIGQPWLPRTKPVTLASRRNSSSKSRRDGDVSFSHASAPIA